MVGKNLERFIRDAYFLAECASLTVCFFLAHWLRGVGLGQTHHDKIFLVAGFFIWGVASTVTHCRQIFFFSFPRMVALAKAALLFVLGISVVAFFFKEAQYSRLIVGYFVVLHALTVYMIHSLVDNYVVYVHRQHRHLKNALFMGDSVVARDLYSKMLEHPEYGYQPMACEPLSVVDDTARFEQVLRDWHINEVVLVCSYSELGVLDSLVTSCDQLGVRITAIPTLTGLVHDALTPIQFFSKPAYRVRDLPLDDIYKKCLKRAFDVAFAFTGLILTAPLFVIVAILVKCTSKGPVLFSQARTGYNQKEFNCYKFRSMRVTAPSVSDTVQATKDDPRKTWIGNVLRKTNIDEIPQFINVLKGDMSVVGPRPHMLAHTDEFSSMVDGYLGRHYVKPGLTGWAQVNGWRGPTDTEEKIRKRVEHDLWYAENWSIWLDIKIILLTVFGSQTRKNAF